VNLKPVSPKPASPEQDIPKPTSSESAISPCLLTPNSLPASLPASRPSSPVTGRTPGFIYPAIDDTSSSSSSSSEDEGTEAKRLKIDPDYVPSTASEGTLTANNSPVVSEREEEEAQTEETNSDEESWKPSRSTSPELYSPPSDD
jgi:hypothetical protein